MVKLAEQLAVEAEMVAELKREWETCGAMRRYRARHSLGLGMDINDSIRYVVDSSGEIRETPTQAMERAAKDLREFMKLEKADRKSTLPVPLPKEWLVPSARQTDEIMQKILACQEEDRKREKK